MSPIARRPDGGSPIGPEPAELVVCTKDPSGPIADLPRLVAAGREERSRPGSVGDPRCSPSVLGSLGRVFERMADRSRRVLVLALEEARACSTTALSEQSTSCSASSARERGSPPMPLASWAFPSMWRVPESRWPLVWPGPGTPVHPPSLLVPKRCSTFRNERRSNWVPKRSERSTCCSAWSVKARESAPRSCKALSGISPVCANR